MAIKYAYDLYPRLDPVNGARVGRFSKLQEAEYNGAANGTGAGRIIVRGNSADGALIDPLGLQYIRVVRINTSVVDGSTLSGFSEKVVGGFFLENGEFEALTEKSTKKLTFGGAGTLSYLFRGIAADQTYIAGSDGPVDGVWNWFFSPAGSIFWRMVTELLDPDRPQSPIAGVTMTFDQSLDSDGNAWPGYGVSWHFTIPVTEGAASWTRRLMEAGVYVWMDPDTFELSAWMANAHGRDRTGGAWGANVVRFQAPTGGVLATGNIKSEAKRGLGALIRRSDLLVGDKGNYDWITDAGADIVWEGGYTVEDPTSGSFAAIGAAQLDARSDAGDTVRLRIMLDNDPANGKYLPFEHIQLDDRPTLHTGTGQWDWNETEQKVAAISLKLRSGGDWDAWVDLGSKYSTPAERAFQVQPVGGHSHPPNPQLCDPVIACGDLAAFNLTDETDTNGDAEDSGGAQWSGGAYTTAKRHGGARSYQAAATSSAVIEYAFGSQVFVGGTRYVLDIWRRLTVDHDSTTLRFGVAGVDDESTTYAGVPGNDPPDLWDEDETGADGAEWNRGRICWTPSQDRTGVRFRFESDSFGASDHAVDDLALYTTTNDDLAGTSTRAARCDHTHHARDIRFSPTGDISATNVQAAIEEVFAAIETTPTDHGDLFGLGDDDHPQYVRATDGGKEVVSVVAASGSTETLDLAVANYHDVTLTANCTLTLAGATAGVKCSMEILLRQDATGSRTVTWPASVKWVGAAAPTLQTAANTWDRVNLESIDGGATWLAQHVASGATDLDDLTDVTITSPANLHALIYDATASQWKNSAGFWRPLMDGAGAVITDGGTGEAIMAFQ